MAALRERAVVVTGASSGIGEAIALRCAEVGAHVLAVGRRADALDALAASAPAGSVVPHVADLLEADACDRVFGAAVAAFGRVHGVAHAAGTVRRGEDIRETTDEELAEQIDSNLGVTFRLARAALRHMTAAGGGSVVLLGSQIAQVGVPGYPSYTAAKGGVTALARSLAVDAGPDGVRVNVLAPGVVQTPMAYVNRPNFGEMIAEIAQRLPLRRIGQPADMAGPAVFLLSDDSAWMTGQTLVVDGGFTIQ